MDPQLLVLGVEQPRHCLVIGVEPMHCWGIAMEPMHLFGIVTEPMHWKHSIGMGINANILDCTTEEALVSLIALQRVTEVRTIIVHALSVAGFTERTIVVSALSVGGFMETDSCTLWVTGIDDIAKALGFEFIPETLAREGCFWWC